MAKTFSKINERNVGTVLVVDALNLAFRDKHAGTERFAEDYIARVESFAQSYKAEKIIITCDLGTSKYRLDIWPDYKLTRKQKFEEQTAEEKEAFNRFFKEFERTIDLAREKFTVLRYRGVEADDLAAYIVKNRDIFNYNFVQLLSSDKDWNLLLNDNVEQFSYVTRKDMSLRNFYELRGVNTPDEYLSMKVLMGESGPSSDNVPGVAQIGPKRAISLIEQYGTAWDIYYNLPIPGKYVHIKNLNDSGNLIERNYKLFDLLTYCEEAIGDVNIADIHEKLK